MDWGQYNPTHWDAVPVPPKYVRPRDRPDIYDRTKAYKSTRPHSLAWHMRHAEAMETEVLRATELKLDWLLTPHTNPLRHYTDAAGALLLDGVAMPIPILTPAPP